MNYIKLFLKGIVVGIGGIAPGLSGSVLMVILDLYTKVIDAIANIFKDFKKNLLFLVPIGIGMICGIVLFSNLVKYSMNNYEIPTRLAFFGLLIGTIPLFYKEVTKKESLKKIHFLLMTISFTIGLCTLLFLPTMMDNGNLSYFQSFILGFIGISAMIIPGVDGAALLSALGLYDNWLDLTSLDSNISVYVCAGVGIIAAGFLLSTLMNILIKKNYTFTFVFLFGLFLSIIPSVLITESGNIITLENNFNSYIGIILFIVGALFSFNFGKLNKE